MQKKDTIVRPAGTWFWYVKTEEEIEHLRAHDRESGRFLDDAGEPLLYSSIGTGMFKEAAVVTITRRRGVPWPHWTKRPRHLVEGLTTIDGAPRLVLLQIH